MSKESRLKAKERSIAARRKAALKKRIPIVLLIVILVTAGILVGKRIADNYARTHVDFTKYINADGTLKDIKSTDYFKTFQDLDAIDLTIALEATEDEVNTLKITYMKLLQSKAEEAFAEGTEDSAVLAALDDAWVEKYAATFLGEDFEHTVEGFNTCLKTFADDSALSEAQSAVTEYMSQNCELKKTPKKYIRFLKKAGMRAIMKAQYNENLRQQGPVENSMSFDEAVKNAYESDKEFQKDLEILAESEAKSDLLWLAVYEKLSLNYTLEDCKNEYYKDAKLTAEEIEADWKERVKAFSEVYLLKDYKCRKAQEVLTERVAGK